MDTRENLVRECRDYLQIEYARLCPKLRQSPTVDNGHLGHGNHMAEDGFDVSEQMMNQALRQNEEYLLREIEGCTSPSGIGCLRHMRSMRPRDHVGAVKDSSLCEVLH